MRVLVLSFYYDPDLSAGSFRTTAFVRALRSRLPQGSRIDVMTTLPNRYQSFSADAPEFEDYGDLTVKRIALPPHQSGMLDQAKAYRRFAWHVLRASRGAEYDLVYATSSRLFTALLGALVARRIRTPLYLDIRDIFNETIRDVAGGLALRFIMPVLNGIERFAFRTAKRVNLVSEGFLEYFESRYPQHDFSLLPNGIDEEFLDVDFQSPVENGGARTVLYAGNIGESQGLHRVLPALARATEGEGFRFEVIGDGGARKVLEQSLLERNVENVALLPPMPRNELMKKYRDASVLFLHLNNMAAFRRVLPSKIFEYAATHKPILAGVSGFAARFLSENVTNVGVFEPCDADEGALALRRLSLEPAKRADFIAKYRRRALMERLADDVLSVAR